MTRVLAVLAMLAVAWGCTCSAPKPKDPYWDRDVCAMCRMAIGDPAYAAQIVGPGLVWRHYDDLGCALAAMADDRALRQGELYVRPKGGDAWVAAGGARYAEGLSTPMGHGYAAVGDGPLTLDDVRARMRAAGGRAP